MLVAKIAKHLGLPVVNMEDGRFKREEDFHDEWAASVLPEQVLVKESFEVCTAPENRFILELLGDLQDRRVLDLGSGLGEAAVFFALRGARVTVCDLSSGMLAVASRVASYHGVDVTLHRAPAEETGLPDASFDVVYAGNALHHVDTERALDEIKRVLVPGGLFVSWDPLAHNPLINIYRRMATEVRTHDEHPLRMRDLDLFRARFRDVQWRCFWFLTLVIFLRFYLVERVHPSKERYWKKILTDAERLSPIYRRLEAWDKSILSVAPWLGRFCWNIVVWGRK
jgi:SAM-dependent methyltransferase